MYKEEPKSVPILFLWVFGDDENTQELWDDYQKEQKSARAEIKAEILKEQEAKTSNQGKETEKWNAWIDSEVENLKADGKIFDKNELMKVALEFKPTDDKGNISLEKSYEILQKMKVKDTAKSDAKKK